MKFSLVSVLTLLSLFFSTVVSLAKYEIKFNPSHLAAPFISHTESRKMGSYLALNLSAKPFQELKKQVEQVAKQESLISKDLIDRGEAHITVITPPEFDQVLSPYVSIDEINKIAEQNKIQETSDLKWTCLGRGELSKESKKMNTFFVVVQSENLLKIRQQIHNIFVQKGGKDKDFQWQHFYPHVTIGFTDRDLHEQDGVIKDKSSCWKNLKINLGSHQNGLQKHHQKVK